MKYARVEGIMAADAIQIEAADISAALLTYARKHPVSHIVVGTGNPPFLGRLLMGSVSEAIVAGAHCAVTVAR